MNGLWLFTFLLSILFLGVPIGLGLILVGTCGIIYYSDLLTAINILKFSPVEYLSSYTLSVIPLFILMGQFAMHSGYCRSLFDSANVLFGKSRGGVGIATVGACAGFGAICGSSVATVATMAQAAFPEMRRLNYSPSFSAGILAASGTLGTLIPPSLVLVIYAILTDQSIGKLFIAALVPGLLAMIGYMAVIVAMTHFNKNLAPSSTIPKTSISKAIQGIIPIFGLFLTIIIGIYQGWFTPTEGASIGTILTALGGYFSKELTKEGIKESLLSTAQLSAMLFFLLIGAEIFNTALALSQFPTFLSTFILEQNLSSWGVLWSIIIILILLGCVMDSLAMILLMVPVFFPIIMQLDFGLVQEAKAIWFGILMLIVVEMGLITPPVGMNLFVLRTVASDIPLTEIYKGIWPFIISDVLRIILIVLFPVLTLGLL